MIKWNALICLLFVFFACTVYDENLKPDILIQYNVVQDSLDLSQNNQAELHIQASTINCEISSVYLQMNSEIIDITTLDTDTRATAFDANYTVVVCNAVQTVQVIVNDNLESRVAREFHIDYQSSNNGNIDNPLEIVIPEIQTVDSGLLDNPAPKGVVYYYNKKHTKIESDIQLEEPISGEVHTRRYLKVAGNALTDDSGYADRAYHSVLFSVENCKSKSNFTIPVGIDHTFSGYLYFKEAGTYTVKAYRTWNNHLYPNRGAAYSVNEGSATLKFTVVVAEGDQVPSAYHHLIPTANVDSGTLYLRDYASKLTAGIVDPLEQVKAIFQFLAVGDENGAFQYDYYYNIYPGYLEDCWSQIFIASHFLVNRVGVCNDFSELFAALTRTLGFKVEKTWGYVPNGGGHQWNRIEINGTWYRLDSTWACGSSNWKRYAEFFAEFDANYFTAAHEDKYSSGLTSEY